MFTDTATSKVTAAHLRATALLYVRQSTLKQVLHNTESAIRQYDLRGRAIALGWTADQIIVIDIDQGQSGASAADREGFQHLVAEVSLGRAGIVLGLECSRLARNSADWHQLLELCAMTGTLICDEDGLYDPRDFNDRLLLGMKGHMSRGRTAFHQGPAAGRGAVQGPPRRADQPLPVGLVYDAAGKVVLDPDDRRAAARCGTCSPPSPPPARPPPASRRSRQAGLRSPGGTARAPARASWTGSRCSTHAVLRVLHNPRYAGAFFYGRHRTRPAPAARPAPPLLPRERMDRVHPRRPPRLHHPGPVRRQPGPARPQRRRPRQRPRAGPPREGPALLQGHHHLRPLRHADDRALPPPPRRLTRLRLPARRHRERRPDLPSLPGAASTSAIGPALDTLTPLAIEAALTVAAELATAPTTPTGCAPRTSNAPATTPTWPAAATWPSTPPTGSSPTPSKPTGTPPCANCATHRQTYDKARQHHPGQLTDAQKRPDHQLATDLPRSGTTRPPPPGNANASPGSCSPTSP